MFHHFVRNWSKINQLNYKVRLDIFNVRKVNSQYVNIRLYELTAIFYDGHPVYSSKKQYILQSVWFVVVGL